MKMPFAIVESGVVKNVVVLDDADADLIAGLSAVPIVNGADIGWGWNGSAFTPPAPQDAAAAKSSVWTRIKAHRDRLTNDGGYQVDGEWFHSDQVSRSQQLGLVLLGANIPAGLQWKTMDGSFVTMTQALATQVLVAAAASDTAIFLAAEVHRTAMEGSTDPSAYDFSAGWPTTFLG